MLAAFIRIAAFGICVFTFSREVSAQQRKIFRINPGEKFADAIPKEEVYSYASFQDGTVYMKGDRYSNAKMNYNALFGDMQFIDEKGDTLSLDNENTIQSIVIKKDTFYYDKGYLRVLGDYGGIKLANRKYFSFTNKQKIGGFGELSSASIDTYDRISSGSTFNELVAKELVTLSEYSLFYVGDRFNHFKPANKKSVSEFFGKREAELQQYVKDNNVDFSKEEDLRKLLLFMQTSQSTSK